MHNNYIISRVL